MSKQLARSRDGISMTDGSLWKNIFLFSVPLIFSQLLQVMFNMADVAVVGKFANATALGSETTIPLPSTKIRMVVVPRSIPMFVPSIFRPPFWLLPR